MSEENVESVENVENAENAQAEEVVQTKDSDALELDHVDNTAIDLLKRNPTTLEDVNAIRAAAYRTPEHWEKFEHFVRDVLKEDEPDYEQKFAIGLAILGQYEVAESKLEALQEVPVAACLLGRIYQETGRIQKAVEVFQKVHKRVPEVQLYHALLAEAYEAADDLDGFRRELEAIEAAAPEDTQTLYLKGLSMERDGDYEEAENCYRDAIEKEPTNTGAMFRLAYRKDLEGNDDLAKEYYQRCVNQGISNVAALTNLGILYDDEERYEEAAKCFAMVTNIYPRMKRARIYLRDADASKIMYYDEEKERKEDKQAQILRIPVTDFELSVRSRNCLSKMNIRTLGDLIKKTEAELLAFKNFGETSLQEIKQILGSKGLRLGMVLTESDELGSILEPAKTNSETDTVMAKPLDELDLSVRSRNCLSLLQIKTLGQLANCTEAQLVACKNFGQTSLNEIRKKLNDFGLTLKS